MEMNIFSLVFAKAIYKKSLAPANSLVPALTVNFLQNRLKKIIDATKATFEVKAPIVWECHKKSRGAISPPETDQIPFQLVSGKVSGGNQVYIHFRNTLFLSIIIVCAFFHVIPRLSCCRLVNLPYALTRDCGVLLSVIAFPELRFIRAFLSTFIALPI